jgi:hypothetical protein
MADNLQDFLNTLTDEEQELYWASVELGDTEFEMEVAEQMGPYGLDKLDASKAEMWDLAKRGYRGFYAPPGFKEAKNASGIRWMAREAKETIKPDHVVMMRPEAANPFEWGHEFRHRSVETKRKAGKETFLPDMHWEKLNRLWDGYLSRSDSDRKQAVIGWGDQMYRDTNKRPTLEEAEADLMKNLDENKEKFIDQEAQSKEGTMPLEDLRRLYRKGYEKRMKSWNDE